MACIVLFLAGIFEIAWAIGLKQSDGFSRLVPSLWSVVAMIVSLGLLAVALRSLPLGTAYAVWTGIGTFGAAVAGVLLYGEPASGLRLACIGLILAGIVGLKLLSHS